MKNTCQLVMLVLCGFLLSACGDSESGSSNAAAKHSASSDSGRFSDDLGNGCELMPAELVSTTFKVPVDKLKQMKVLGCLYSWSDDASELSAHIMMIRVHESVAAAATWFESSTKNRTAEEVQAEMRRISERVEKRLETSDDLNTDMKKSFAKGLLNISGSKAVVFEDVPAVGDEARINVDGNISVRVDNLTFIVAAYHGPKQPPPEMAGLNVQQMMAAVRESADQRKVQTLPQRKLDGTKLAKAVVARL